MQDTRWKQQPEKSNNNKDSTALSIGNVLFQLGMKSSLQFNFADETTF